jgi:hypothetical protein
MMLRLHSRNHFWCDIELAISFEVKDKSNNWGNDCFSNLNFKNNRSISSSWIMNRPYISQWRLYIEYMDGANVNIN